MGSGNHGVFRGITLPRCQPFVKQKKNDKVKLQKKWMMTWKKAWVCKLVSFPVGVKKQANAFLQAFAVPRDHRMAWRAPLHRPKVA